ncbi:MAG: hypothetical protein M3Q03_02010 [Chloroflexota bacterium]|nr:hypothetical protein [Chloroflexota bacterium]
MDAIHSTVGTLVVLAYLVLTVIHLLGVNGRSFSWVRPLSFAAAGLLLLQYVLGFSLLGSGYRNAGSHYAFALLALVTVGMEHGYAGTRDTPRARHLTGALATGLTFLLVVVTYIIGQSNG